MRGWRVEERWAADVLSASLSNVLVERHDDGTRPGMHDLAILYPGRRRAAVEVTTVVDSTSTEFWRLINPSYGRWCEPQLKGGWVVHVLPTASAKRLRAQLPPLLGDLEAANIDTIGSRGYGMPGAQIDRIEALGIVYAHRVDTSYPGSVYVILALPHEQTAGFVPSNGDALPKWASDWVREPSRSDNLAKLAASGAAERHLVVVVTALSGVPFAVGDLLMRDDAPLPQAAPELPAEITDLWVMSTWSSGHGHRWTTDGWHSFDKLARRRAAS